MHELKYLTVQMLCEYIHKSRSTVYKMIQNKTIPYTKLGRGVLFKREDIDLWINNGCVMETELVNIPKIK